MDLERFFAARVQTRDQQRARAKTAAWRKQNPKRVKASNEKYRRNNPQKIRAKKRRYYLRNAEKIRAKTRRWYSENPEKSRNAHRSKRYGLSPAQFDQMLLRQQNACACCNVFLKETPYVDHCHITKVVRGLLCKSCNLMLGHAKDNADTLVRGAAYLRGKTWAA